MLEADAPFMMMRSGTRKYQSPPLPVGAPQPLPADDDVPTPAPAAPDPPPDTPHAAPKYFANRLFAGPSSNYDPELDAEFYGRDSDEPYEDQVIGFECSMLEANSPAGDDEEHEHAHLYNEQGGIIDPYYSETESDLLTDSGWGIDEPWLTGEGPGMHTFTSFDDFVYHYRIYSPTDELFWMWAEAAPDEDIDAPDAVDEEG